MSTTHTFEVRPVTRERIAERHDLYQPIHKALRALMADTLLRLGALDVCDAEECAATLTQTESLLGLVDSHLDHEDRFLHPALQQRAPELVLQIEAEHAEHRASTQALRAELQALRFAPLDDAALRLYRHLALFIAENLSHMHFEETVLNAALWAHFSDAELQAMHERLVASIAPAEMALTLRWMVPAMTPAQRVGFFSGLQHQAPPEAVRGALDSVRPWLNDTAWAKLSRGLGLAPAPGLVAWSAT